MCDYELQAPIFVPNLAGELTVYLPDDDFTFFGFHAKINENMEVLETGTINEETIMMNEDTKKWTVFIKNISLNDGDTVYYWIHVIRNGMDFHKTGSWRARPDYECEMAASMAPVQTIIMLYERNNEYIEKVESDE